MPDDLYVPQQRPWNQHDQHISLIVLVGFASFLFSAFIWFTWLFGGTPQKSANLLSFVQAALLVSLSPGTVLALVTFLIAMPRRLKVGYAVAGLLPSVLYSAFQVLRLYSATIS